MATDSGASYEVYIGPWINWSYDQVLGSTLTLTRADANLLIAFVAFFVAFVGTRLWRILCFALHWIYSSQDAQDGLHHQRQAFLRNSANPEASLLILVELLWSWRRNAQRPLLRLMVLLVLTVIWTVGFALASGFSSKISPSTTSEVLLSGRHCGLLGDDEITGMDPIESMSRYHPYVSKHIASAASYAEQCYSANDTSGLLTCATFRNKRLPSIVNPNADCPFDPSICRSQNENIMIDSGYLDLHDHFGVNIPSGDRFQFRRVVHCAPLTTVGYTSQSVINGTRRYTGYHYGGIQSNQTYLYPSDPTFEMTRAFSNFSTAQADYDLQAYEARFEKGEIMASSSNFDPIAELRAPDADINLVFLSAGKVLFAGNVTDPWYRATRPGGKIVIWNGGDAAGAVTLPVYFQDEPASPLACVLREQYCSPGLPSGNCTGLLTSNDAYSDAFTALLESDPDRADRLKWAVMTLNLGSPTLSFVVRTQGGKALSSRLGLNLGVQGPLPTNQWQLDVQFWFNSGLASMQSAFVATSTGPSDPLIAGYASPPNTTVEKTFCTNIKILSTSYVSFSVFGIAFIFAFGGLTIFVSVAIDPIMAFLQQRYGIRRYQQLEWSTNDTLQLQRLAHEEIGSGTWSNTTKFIPVTEYGEKLALLDLSDPSHPILGKPNVFTMPTPVLPSEKQGPVETTTALSQTTTPNGSDRGGSSTATSPVHSYEQDVDLISEGDGSSPVSPSKPAHI